MITLNIWLGIKVGESQIFNPIFESSEFCAVRSALSCQNSFLSKNRNLKRRRNFFWAKIVVFAKNEGGGKIFRMSFKTGKHKHTDERLLVVGGFFGLNRCEGKH